MPHRIRVILAILILLLIALPTCGQTVREEMLVSAYWLQQHLRSVTLLQIDDAAEYARGHIERAVLIEPSSLLVDRDGTPNEMPPIDLLERTLTAAGIGSRRRIVVYSSDPLLAARAWFTLDFLGQGDRTALLDGGLAQWIAAGHPVTTEAVIPRPEAFSARPRPGAIAHLSTMRDLARRRDQLGPNLVLIDARSVTQFCGDEAGAGVRRPGHIPGASNIPAAANLAANGLLKSVYDLRLMYLHAGVTAKSANIVYCRTGTEAAMAYFVLRYLGYDASLYDGSFIEWSNAGEMIWS